MLRFLRTSDRGNRLAPRFYDWIHSPFPARRVQATEKRGGAPSLGRRARRIVVLMAGVYCSVMVYTFSEVL